MTPSNSHRRVVLVDFDWQDADLMPQLLAQPGVSIRLVAGESSESAGLKLAEMCGLPRTTDLGDLTREIFDLALISERSARRTQVEGLLGALGTPSCSPTDFLGQVAKGGPTGRVATPEPTGDGEQPRPIEEKAVALESALSGRDLDDLLAEALPAEAEPPARRTPKKKGKRAPILQVLNLNDFPSPEDRRGLENALRILAQSTGAAHAALRIMAADAEETVAEVGQPDPVTEALVKLACLEGTPQVMQSVSGTSQGKSWGAWPFRTTQHRAVVAASSFDSQHGYRVWESLVDELRDTWDLRDRGDVAITTVSPGSRRSGWLDQDAFGDSIQTAVERNRRDGLHFSLHRIEFAPADGAIDALCEVLPNHLRDRDSLARSGANAVVLLAAGPPAGFKHVRERIMELWNACWRATGDAGPVPALDIQSVELTSPLVAMNFVTTAREWLGVPE